MATLHHSSLGRIYGCQINDNLIQFRSIPYASIEQRFARSHILDGLPLSDGQDVYDATKIGPSSIQPFDAARMDADSNQLPSDIIVKDQTQSEDCLRMTITVPASCLPLNDSKSNSFLNGKLPVLVFLHGGAFFLNSGERPYYSPINLLTQACTSSQPLLFVSVNYRLGTLGFLHSSQAADLIPPNNGLHDQLRAFEWIKRNISGFGGDPDNITAIGQSAGAESLSLHNISGQKLALYKRSISFSGTPVTMPAKTPGEHEESFRMLAKKLEIDVGEELTSADIANTMIHNMSVDKIRKLGSVGAPCSESEILPYKRPTMSLSRSGPSGTASWLDSQIVSSAGYDGSISWIITKKNSKRKHHAASFRRIASEVIGVGATEELCGLYGISEQDIDEDKNVMKGEDESDLTKICQFETDIGFICAAEAVAEGSVKHNVSTYMQIFDLPNPFEGYLEPERYTTHCWDIVALLGAYDERLSKQYLHVIKIWRAKIIEYCVSGNEPWTDFQNGNCMFVSRDGLDVSKFDGLADSVRRTKLKGFASRVAGDRGCDVLWEDVCRRWLDKGS